VPDFQDCDLLAGLPHGILTEITACAVMRFCGTQLQSVSIGWMSNAAFRRT
jgi:hypothetical protein